VHGESITIETEGKVLVLPSGNPDILTSHNEYTLNSNRLTIAESPFGGLKGSGSPDYCVGTVNIIEGYGVYLQDVNGQNSSKTLSAGKLKELNLLSVDTTNHSITEEFIVANTAESNNPTVIDDCDSTDGWVQNTGTVSNISVENGKLKIVGTASAAGNLAIQKNIALDLSTFAFLSLSLTSSNAGWARIGLYSGGYVIYKFWENSRFSIAANTETRYNLPILSPVGTNGSNAFSAVREFSTNTVTRIVAGIGGLTSGQAVTFYLDNITADTAKSATIEVQVPDNLSATSLSLYTHNGTAYQLCSTHSLDGAYSQISQTSANCTILDGTKLDDVYGTGAGRAVFPKSSAGTTVNGSTGSITYSENRGTDKRIGLKFNLPPSDNGRTNFNKVRAKLVINYTDTVGNVVPDLSGNNNTGTILANVSKTSDSYLFSSVNTMKAIEHATVTHSAGTIEFIADVMRGNKTGWSMIASFGGYVSTKGWYIGWESDTLKVKVNDGVTSKMAHWGDPSPSTRKTIRLLIDQVAKTIIVYADGNIVINDTFPRVGDITPVASTPFLIGSDGISIDSLHGAIYSYSLSYNGYKVLDVVPTLNHMGSTTYELSNDNNASTGLQNLSKPWLALLDAPRKDILPDSSGNGNNGSMVNVEMAADSTGNLFGALAFNGSTSVVDIQDVDAFTSDNFTIVSSIKWDGIRYAGTSNNDWCTVLSKGKYNAGEFALIISRQNENSNTNVNLYINGKLAVSWINYIIDTNWHRLVVVYDKKNAIVYFDGQLKKSSGFTESVANTTTTIKIGKSSNGTYTFGGDLADTRFYRRALSPEEVTADFNGQPVSSTGLVASWKPYQPSREIDFYLFTHRPKNLEYKKDESGTIHELKLFPGNGQIYHGRVTHCNPALDSDSNNIPDCLEASIEGSITKFLQSYGMVI
jgi:hypothetical protein